MVFTYQDNRSNIRKTSPNSRRTRVCLVPPNDTLFRIYIAWLSDFLLTSLPADWPTLRGTPDYRPLNRHVDLSLRLVAAWLLWTGSHAC